MTVGKVGTDLACPSLCAVHCTQNSINCKGMMEGLGRQGGACVAVGMGGSVCTTPDTTTTHGTRLGLARCPFMKTVEVKVQHLNANIGQELCELELHTSV